MTNENEIEKIYASTFRPGENAGNLGDIFGYLAIEKLSKRTLRLTGIPEKDNIDNHTILLVGSILNHIKPGQNALIYGPRFTTSEDNPKKLSGNRIAGVRGKPSKKIIEKDIIGKLDGDGYFIDCSSPYDSEIENFLANNLPEYLNKRKNIKVFLEMYEGNFSALLNDLEILKLLEITEESEAMKIFTNNGDKNNYKLIEHISKNDSDSALSIIDSMKRNDRNSVPLLIWILARDINAIKFIKDGKNLKSLGIWDNQIHMYKKISDRTSKESIDKSIIALDGIDKCFKGVQNGDTWNGIKDIVLELSA